jgi:hypothetical protein
MISPDANDPCSSRNRIIGHGPGIPFDFLAQAEKERKIVRGPERLVVKSISCRESGVENRKERLDFDIKRLEQSRACA